MGDDALAIATSTSDEWVEKLVNTMATMKLYAVRYQVETDCDTLAISRIEGYVEIGTLWTDGMKKPLEVKKLGTIEKDLKADVEKNQRMARRMQTGDPFSEEVGRAPCGREPTRARGGTRGRGRGCRGGGRGRAGRVPIADGHGDAMPMALEDAMHFDDSDDSKEANG